MVSCKISNLFPSPKLYVGESKHGAYALIALVDETIATLTVSVSYVSFSLFLLFFNNFTHNNN